MTRSLIVTCGDPSRGDAGAAVQVARSLLAGFCDPQTQVYFCREWTFEIADFVRDFDQVIFLEASPEFAPGSVSVNRVSPYPAHLGQRREFSPSRLLTFCQQKYAQAPAITYQIYIGVESFGSGNRISARVRPAIPAALERIKAILSGVSLPETRSPAHAVHVGS